MAKARFGLDFANPRMNSQVRGEVMAKAGFGLEAVIPRLKSGVEDGYRVLSTPDFSLGGTSVET